MCFVIVMVRGQDGPTPMLRLVQHTGMSVASNFNS